MGTDIMWDHRVKERFNNSQYKKKNGGSIYNSVNKVTDITLKEQKWPQI